MTNEEIIARVMDGFDAVRVQKMMEAVDWQWIGTDERNPQFYEINKKGRKLLGQAVEMAKSNPSGKAGVGTGGLWAEYDNGWATLSFVGVTSEYDSEWDMGVPF